MRIRYQFFVVGYVIMPEHIHLLISEPQEKNPSTLVQALKLGFARRWEGHFSEARSGAPPVVLCLARSSYTSREKLATRPASKSSRVDESPSLPIFRYGQTLCCFAHVIASTFILGKEPAQRYRRNSANEIRV
jgi:hypothetical protein